MAEFAAVINVSTLNGTNGFRLDGDAADDRSGGSVSGGGDVNGDGRPDLLVGAPVSDTGGVDRGLAWVVFGAVASPAAQGLAARVLGGTAYRFQGEAAGDQAGLDIANAGDVNGDGFDDLIIGALYADPDSVAGDRGASYLVFGGATKLELLDAANGANDNRITLATLTPATGFRFDGAADGDNAGASVSGAGDVNGDGFADLLIGAPYAEPESGSEKGASYIVFGGTANLGDLDNDDGPADGRIDLAQISPGQGLRVEGAVQFSGDRSGYAVALVGDVNGDGFDDALIGARLADPNGVNTSEGAAYLVFGKSQADFVDSDGDALLDGSIELGGIDGLTGTRFDGVASLDDTGNAVSGLGDVNGDGFADIAIGAQRAEPAGTLSGSAFVVFGKGVFGPSNDLSALNGANGFRFNGLRPGDDTGASVSAAGDVNGDGFDDIVVGARRASNNGLTYSGSTYVIYGHRADTAVTRVGTAIDNRINGGKEDDSISGLSGDDTLIGWEGDDDIQGGGGIDSLNGGDGDDALAGGSEKDTLSGGAGNDKISGGSERDVIIASAGEDHIDGGSEKDLWDFTAFGAALPIVLNLATRTFTHPNEEDVQTFASIEDVNGTAGADAITGNHVRNTLRGGNGADTLDGAGGADNITGGGGRDVLTGGAKGDRFIFTALADSAIGAASRDHITDFTVDPAATTAFVDRIDVSAIDAKAAAGGNDAFTFIGGAAFTAEGQIRAVQSGADTLVEFNTSGGATAEMRIELDNFTAAGLAAADFVL